VLQWLGVQAEQAGIAQWITQAQSLPHLAWVDYPTPAVIYGRRGGVTPERQTCAQARGCALLARRSGGGAVLAGPWLLGFHLWLPQAHSAAALSAVQSMQSVGVCVAQALRSLDQAVALASAQDMARNTARVKAAALEWNCFAGLSHGELLDATGRKCLGLSQARVAAGVLISGGLLTQATPWPVLDFVHHGGDPAPSLKPSVTASLVSDGITAVHTQQRDAFKHQLAQALARWLNAAAPQGARHITPTISSKPLATPA